MLSATINSRQKQRGEKKKLGREAEYEKGRIKRRKIFRPEFLTVLYIALPSFTFPPLSTFFPFQGSCNVLTVNAFQYKNLTLLSLLYFQRPSTAVSLLPYHNHPSTSSFFAISFLLPTSIYMNK